MSFFERMRDKDERSKKNFAFFISAIITLVIIVVWFTTLSVRLDRVDGNVADSPLVMIKEKVVGVFK